MRNGRWRNILAIAIAASLVGSTRTAQAQPQLTIAPDSGPAGTVVTLRGNGFSPRFGAGIFFDDVEKESVIVRDDGSFELPFGIPPGSEAGPHEVLVCTVCVLGAEFEERAAGTFTVLGPPVPEDPFNVQGLALEVTQAIRGAIPSRTPPDGARVLPADPAVHVAGKRTVVRVYPWITSPQGAVTPPLTALLYGSNAAGALPESPLRASNRVRVRPAGDLPTMRGDAATSWNFVLPASWVEEGTINLAAEVNPRGLDHWPECVGCDADNELRLFDVEFRRLQTQPIEIRAYLAEFVERDDQGRRVSRSPTYPEFFDALHWWLRAWPVDPSRVRITTRRTRFSNGDASPPIDDVPVWDNQVFIDENPTDTTCCDTRPYLYIPLVFSPSSSIGCSGQAGVGSPPLFHAGACGPTMAQEAAHSIGLNHASDAHGESSGGGVDPNYPGPHGEVEPFAYGFDVQTLRAIPPSGPEGHTHDFMSYGGGPMWTSAYSWQQIAGKFGAPGIAPIAAFPRGSVSFLTTFPPLAVDFLTSIPPLG